MNCVGFLSEGFPGEGVVGVDVSVFCVKGDGLDIADESVVAKFGRRRPYSLDGSRGVPFAAEFVVDAYVDGEVAGCVVRRDDGTYIGSFLDAEASPVAKVEVAIGRVGFPDDAVDTYLVFAAAAGADAAEVERPAEDPAVICWPIVADDY